MAPGRSRSWSLTVRLTRVKYPTMVKETLTPSRDRREQEKLATREKILDAAREMFNESGVEATTMRAIADRIGYTATAIYYHFRDKDALLLELCHSDFGRLANSLGQARFIPDPIERIRATGLAYVDFALTNPSQYRFMFMTESHAHTPEEVGLERGNPEEDAHALLVSMVQEAIDKDRLRPEFTNANDVANLLWAAMHGVASLYMTKKHDHWCEFGDPRELARTMAEVTLRGITK